MSLLIGVIISGVIAMIGLFVGPLLWAFTRPKKETWFANVYRVSEGVRLQKDKNGNIIKLKIKDLIPLQKDIAEKRLEKPGITVFQLQKLKKALPPITEDCVTFWNNGRKEIDVLSQGGNYTLLKKGYDKVSGEELFKPIPVDDINILESNLALKQNRFKKEKDILEAISPWVTAIIIGLVITTNTYLIVGGWKYQADTYTEGVDKLTSALVQTGAYAENIESIRQTGKPLTQESIGIQKEPPKIDNLG